MILDQLSNFVLQDKRKENQGDVSTSSSTGISNSKQKKLDVQCVAQMTGHTNYVFSMAVSGIFIF